MTGAGYRGWLYGAITASALLLPCLSRADGCPPVDPEALKWLDKMTRGVDEVSYHGVITFQRDGEDMQVMEVSHSVNGDTSTERMTQLTGQGAQVERKDHPLQCVHPGVRLLRLGEALKAGDCGIAESYRFHVDEGPRVAGRKSVKVIVSPRDLYRYGYVLELDRKTGLLLKSETVGQDKLVLEKFQFADLAYNDRQPQATDVNLVHEAEHTAPGTTASPGDLPRGWVVNWLPRGFTPTDAQPVHAARRTYTDGLAVFSVFVEELNRALRPGEGVVRKGSTLSYTRGMALDGQPVLVTVVGEVPVNTARMVADSLAWAR